MFTRSLAVLVSSFGFVLQDMLFDLTSYRAALFCYALGVLFGITPALLQRGMGKTCQRLIKYCRLIFFAELFAVIATLTSMRAISLAPSVSLVAVIETSRPLVIMKDQLDVGLLSKRVICLVSLALQQGIRLFQPLKPA